MKKFYLALVCFTLISVVTAQDLNQVEIAILSDVTTTETDSLLTRLQSEIRRVLGTRSTAIFSEPQYNLGNLEKAKEQYKQAVSGDSDIILVFGLASNMTAFLEDNYPKPTIVVGSVNSDFLNLPEDRTTSSIDNFTYLVAPISYRDDLDTFSSLYKYKRVGFVVDDRTAEILPIEDLLSDYFDDKDATYKIIRISQVGDIEGQLEDVDAVYLAGAFSLNPSLFDNLVSEINGRKIPSFSSFSKRDVELGILATGQPTRNINRFFRRIAFNIESIVNGINLSERPIIIDYDTQISINYNTAEIIGFPLRYNMLRNADFIGSAKAFKKDITYSLVDIMNLVLNRNLDLVVSEKSVELSTQDVRTAKSNFLPDISAGAGGLYTDPRFAEVLGGANSEFTTSGNVSLNQTIYSEQAGANITIQENLQKAQEEVFNASQLDALLDASIAYFNALILKRNTEIQNQNLQITKQNLRIANQNFEAGAASKSDVLRFTAELAQNIQSLVEASNQLKQSYYTINQLVNNDIALDIDIEDASIGVGVFAGRGNEDLLEIMDDPLLRPGLVEFLISEAKNNAPELKNLEYNLAATDRSYKLSDYGRFIPTVSLQGNYNLAISQSGAGSEIPVIGPDGTYVVGLNLSLPIVQQNRQNINRLIATIQEDQLTAQKESTELNIERRVNDLVLNVMNEISNIETSEVAVEAAQEGLELTQNAYEQGEVPIIQLIDAQNTYLGALLSNATANYSYLLASAELERAIGYFFLMNTDESNQSFVQRATEFILNNN